DENAQVRLRVTAVNPDGTLAAYSNAIGPVANALPVSTVAPAVSGDAKRGALLRGTGGSWTGAGNRYALQWQRDTGSGYADIPGARSSSYRLQSADVGATVRLQVVASNPDGRVEAYTGGVGPVAG